MEPLSDAWDTDFITHSADNKKACFQQNLIAVFPDCQLKTLDVFRSHRRGWMDIDVGVFGFVLLN